MVIGKDLTILGALNVQQYQNQNIINTTTTNYQLIISEDLSLNGRLSVSGNASFNNATFYGNVTGLNNYALKSLVDASFASLNTNSEASISTFKINIEILRL
jgi:hypothetical protein